MSGNWITTEDRIAHSRPAIGLEEREALQSVLDSHYLSRGSKTQDFESAVGSWLGMPHAHLVASGTCALQLALLSLAQPENLISLSAMENFFRDRTILIPAYVCTAVLNAVRWTGARPVLMDVEESTGCVSPQAILEQADASTLAAVVAYLFGHPGKQSLPQVPFAWVEDIAQAIGAQRNGSPVGSEGHYAVCSFYATKVITTGVGGMVLTRNQVAAKRIADLLQYDNQSDALLHLSWNLGELEAAMGLAQWNRLEKSLQRRREIAEIYSQGLAELPLIESLPTEGSARSQLIPGHIYYRYCIRLSWGLDEFIERMNAAGIEVKRPVFIPLYRILGDEADPYPITEKLYRTTASLPIYPELSDQQAVRVVETARKVLSTL